MTDGHLNFDTKIDTSGFKKGIKELKNQANSTGSGLKKIAVSAGTVLKKLAVSAGAAVGSVALFSAKVGISFESAFAGVAKTVDATEEQLADLKQGIRDIPKEMPTFANEIANVAAAAGQLGIKTENIREFSKTTVMLGDSTNMAAEEAATTLARFANGGLTQNLIGGILDEVQNGLGYGKYLYL